MNWKHMYNLKVISAHKLATSFLRRLGAARSEEQIEGNLLFDTSWMKMLVSEGDFLSLRSNQNSVGL